MLPLASLDLHAGVWVCGRGPEFRASEDCVYKNSIVIAKSEQLRLGLIALRSYLGQKLPVNTARSRSEYNFSLPIRLTNTVNRH